MIVYVLFFGLVAIIPAAPNECILEGAICKIFNPSIQQHHSPHPCMLLVWLYIPKVLDSTDISAKAEGLPAESAKGKLLSSELGRASVGVEREMHSKRERRELQPKWSCKTRRTGWER